MTAARLFHTVRHLKPVQVYGRVLGRLARPRADTSDAPPVRLMTGAWAEPAPRPASLLGRWRVRFLNEEGEIARQQQWNDPAKAKLWLYNLHYFDDLATPADLARRALQRELVERWIDENPPTVGNGWEPYPVSLRVVNWIKWALAGETMPAHWRHSLAIQTRWLEQHIEWHLLGNHLLANAKALVLAGLYFEGEEADRWLETGLSIHARQLPEQVLADGAHFELSPMYHATILEDLLDLLNAGRAYRIDRRPVLAGLPTTIERMRCWLAAMTHPDGGPSFFNDSALGIAPSRGDLEAYAARLGLGGVAAPGEGVHRLAASGYVRIDRGDAVAILDVAAVGPDYIPGHAHADTLSLELSLGRERIIVNGGTSVYAPGPLRESQRATRAHSTVEIDGESSSEVWASFRVARRARVRDCRIAVEGSEATISAAHDGYRRLSGRPLHRRTWRIGASTLVVADAVESAGANRAVARFHLAPGLAATVDPGGRSGVMTSPAGRVVRWMADCPALVEPGCWYPEFGKAVTASTLAIAFQGGRLTTTFDWS